MKIRNLLRENKNHYNEWRWVYHELYFNHQKTQDQKKLFIGKWKSGTVTLGEWLNSSNDDIEAANKDLTEEERKLVENNTHLLYDLWLEYKVQYGLMGKLYDVVRYTPHNVQLYADQELTELNTFLSGKMASYSNINYRNTKWLDRDADFPKLVADLSSGLPSNFNLHNPNFYHQAEAVLRYRRYLEILIAEGLDKEVNGDEPEKFSFQYYWPELHELKNHIVVEYKVKKLYFKEDAYVDYIITSVGGANSEWGLKNHIKGLFKAGFEKMLADISSMGKTEQRSILSDLREETESLKDILVEGDYVSPETEYGPKQEYLFKKFESVIYKGENDFRFALFSDSRAYMAYKMTDYVVAWTEAVDEISRKIEHAINNIDLIAVWSEKPTYEVEDILNEVYVIESVQGMIQGTAFYLAGIGIVTCDHCVRDSKKGILFNDLVLYSTRDLAKKVKVKVLKWHSHIDLAILELEDNEKSFLNSGLPKGNSDNIVHTNYVAVAGFPNYRPGDSGYFTEGQVTGFRTISSIRHIQVSNILVEGNSGGPAINSKGEVIGVAATGAESFKGSSSTEKHGIIPINAIELII